MGGIERQLQTGLTGLQLLTCKKNKANVRHGTSLRYRVYPTPDQKILLRRNDVEAIGHN